MERHGVAFRLNGKFFFSLHGIARDLGARALLQGDGIYQSTHERNRFLASLYGKGKTGAVAIFRADEKMNKLISLGSKNYTYIPQSLILSVIETLSDPSILGEFEMVHWFMDHNITQCVIKFPHRAEDMARMYGRTDLPMPCMLIESSDSGDCSFTATPLWQLTGGSYVRGEGEFSRKHYGSVTPEGILKDIAERTWSTYTKLPERLCELALIDAPDPKAVVEWVFTDPTLKLADAVGKRVVDAVCEAVCMEFVPGVKYTLMDIVLILMGVPARLDLTENRKKAMETALYKCAFRPLEEIPSVITLMPT